MDWPEDLTGIRSAMQAIAEKHCRQLENRSANVLKESALSTLKAELASLLGSDYPFNTVFLDGASIRDILEELLKSCDTTSIASIRFYRYSETNNDGSYLLVDSAGYDDETASRLVNRGLQLFRSGPLCSDSFWADTLGVPTAFTIERNSSSRLEPRFYPGCLPLIPTPHDSCEDSLAGAKSPTWIDVPLSVCGKTTGKISCDFEYPVAALKNHHADIMHFCALAQLAAPFLEVLYQRQFVDPLTELSSRIQACATLDALFSFCTTTLPQFFSALNASIFTLSKDSFGKAKLVLECTSFQGARPYVGHAVYGLQDAALTAWVARNNRSLRLHNLAEEHERELQLDQFRVFDDNLRWEDRVTDSNNHTSYLAVPIPADAGRAGGVLRFTEKDTDGHRHFTNLDQARLEILSRDAISRRLMSLQSSKASSVIAYEYLQDANMILVSDQIPTTPAVLAATKSVLDSLFSTSALNGKSFRVHLLANDCKHFQEYRLDASTDEEITDQKVLPLTGSLTEFVLREFQQDESHCQQRSRVVFVNDCDNAKQRAHIAMGSRDVESVLACPISFRRKVYAVLIVESDRHDLCRDSHGHWLELIAAQAGTMFARRDHANLTKLKAEAKTLRPSELVAWLSNLERTFSSHHLDGASTPLQQINLRQTVTDLARDAGVRSNISVPDVEVLAHRPPLVGVMYQALKELCVNSTSSSPIQIRGRVKDQWFELIVEKFFEDCDPLEGTMWNDDNPDVVFDNPDSGVIAWSRKLAYFAQIDSKRGSIRQINRDLIVQFPSG